MMIIIWFLFLSHSVSGLTAHYHYKSSFHEKSRALCSSKNVERSDRYKCDSDGNVICMPGWKDPISLCSIPICKNDCTNGRCIYPSLCECDVGWDGLFCDRCIPYSGCKYGSCVKPFDCICDLGWTGRLCDKPRCNLCQNGRCYEPDKCDFGWKGTSCSECIPRPNCQNGRCVKKPFECVCDTGWTGLDCDIPICSKTCHKINGYCKYPETCICKNGWMGENCDICIPYDGCEGRCINNIPWTCDSIELDTVNEWNSWSHWSPCSKSCDRGTQKRVKTCLDKNRNIGHCTGKSFELRSCHTVNCRIEGMWGAWTEWSSCSASCGSGLISRHRICVVIPGQSKIEPCSGGNFETKKCFIQFCPIHGEWSIWEVWRPCTASCGIGKRIRIRHCNSPIPSHGGLSCWGRAFDKQACRNRECPIDAHWMRWSPWTKCSKSCGEGKKQRSRKCSTPLFGGKLCFGVSSIERDIISCWIKVYCSQDGGWSEWRGWSKCSVTCGENGLEIRHRLCTNPKPMFGGKKCFDRSSENRYCSSNIRCPINGKWGFWSSWTQCSVTCGFGFKKRSRMCDEPKYRGDQCSGRSEEMMGCIKSNCQKDGYWLPWSQWSACSKTCNNGTRTRSRACVPPSDGGIPCIGPEVNRDFCYVSPCQTEESWTKWSDCSVTCGTGVQTRNRKCSSSNDSSCLGVRNEEQKCNGKAPCSYDEEYSPWSQWSRCSMVCEGSRGSQVRKRFCVKSKGNKCMQKLKQYRHCTGDIPMQDIDASSNCFYYVQRK